jgi:hypothetical protein
MQMPPVEFLARFLNDLQGKFGAEVIEARDELDGAIVVDVRLDARRALKAHRGLVRERAVATVGMSRNLVDRTNDLYRRAGVLRSELEITEASRRRKLDQSRRQIQQTRALRDDSSRS